MTQDEFPDDLVERCAKAMRQDAIARTTNNRGIFDPDVPSSESERANARAVLRANGYAKLVAALDWTRLWIKTRCPQAARNDVVARIEAALAAAGHTQRVREFVNELGNRIKITIEGPTSVSENILTKREFDELCLALANEGRVGAPSSPTFDEELAARLSGGIAELEPAITAALRQSASAARTKALEEARSILRRRSGEIRNDRDGQRALDESADEIETLTTSGVSPSP